MAAKKDDDFDTDMGSEKDADTGRKDADDQEGDGDDDGQEDDDEEPSLDDLKRELAKTKAALRKANREAQTKRLAARKGTAGRAPRAKDQEAEAVAEAEVEKYRTAALRTGAAAGLMAAGLKVGDNPKATARRVAKLLDLDGVELSEDGDLEGLDDAIEELKEEMPELFQDAEEKPARRRAAGRIDAHAGRGNRPTGGKDQKSSAERLGEALRSGR